MTLKTNVAIRVKKQIIKNTIPNLANFNTLSMLLSKKNGRNKAILIIPKYCIENLLKTIPYVVGSKFFILNPCSLHLI